MKKANFIKLLFTIMLVFVFTGFTIGAVSAETLQIKPKTNKKIKIGVIDLISAIEVAALFNNHYKEAAKRRGWEVQVMDLNMAREKGEQTLDNLITAGYDGVIINWTAVTFFEKALARAYDNGIPVFGLACGAVTKGITGEYSMWDGAGGALGANYLAVKLGQGKKVLAFYDPQQAIHRQRFGGAKGVLEAYGIQIKELHYPGSGDPQMTADLDRVQNTCYLIAVDHSRLTWAPPKTTSSLIFR